MRVKDRLKRLETQNPQKLDLTAAAEIEKAVAPYNTPAAETERAAFYELIQKAGAARRQAHADGRGMDAIPLPFTDAGESANLCELMRI